MAIIHKQVNSLVMERTFQVLYKSDNDRLKTAVVTIQKGEKTNAETFNKYLGLLYGYTLCWSQVE